MNTKNNLRFSLKYTIFFCVLLLALCITLVAILLTQSGKSMTTLIRNHMTAVTNTAAALVDGDTIASFTEEDVGTPEYQKIADLLITVKNVQMDSDIKYIYITKKSGDGFVFVLDPDPENPADFGEEVVYTEAQNNAWLGTAGVDDEPLEDEWGNYYSAWSPVKDSFGRVVAVVGIDFSADRINEQIASQTELAVIIGLLFIFTGAAVVLILTSKLRSRIRELDGELSVLSTDLNKLSEEIKDQNVPEKPLEISETKTDSKDVIVSLSERVRSMEVELKGYINYINDQAYKDSMTGVGNRTAYLDRVKELNTEIESGSARFSVAIFDINGLKNVNDNYGHEIGDYIIKDAAELICHSFPNDHIFRIGGDEFVAIAYTTQAELVNRLNGLDNEITNFNNSKKEYDIALSLAHGSSEFVPGQDKEYKDVFTRADKAMYSNKADFYRDLID